MMDKKENDGFIAGKTHLDCPSCGHKGCYAINQDGSGWCFSCRVRTPKTTINGTTVVNITPNAKLFESKPTYLSLSDRKISQATASKYGVQIVQSSTGTVAEHLYPYYNENGDKTATKRRVTKNKDFHWLGSSTDTVLFGQQLFKAGGKYITITEGECDAMSAYELMGSKWAVVSIKHGAGNAEKDVKESLEFIESFDNVVICFDSDKQGKEAAKKVARLLKPGKAKIMSIPNGYKDANDMLKENQHKKFVSCFWDAKTYTPVGVINVIESKEDFHNREMKDSVPYPYKGLNNKLYGLRQGELLTLTGGTGLGKSSVTRELEHHLLKNTNDNVGIIALEEDWRRTVDGVLSIEAGARLYIDQVRENYTQEEIDKLFDILKDEKGDNRLWVHAHFGTNDIEEIFSKLRFMIIGCGCKWVIVDHLHMLVSATLEGDERRAIDAIMTKLRSIVEETGAGLILVSHLRRVEGNKGHENGVTVNLSHLRGSQSIAQLSDCVIALERNQQSDDPEEANTTVMRVLKSRYTGDVGFATKLLYDKESGRLSEVALDSFEEDNKDLEWN